MKAVRVSLSLIAALACLLVSSAVSAVVPSGDTVWIEDSLPAGAAQGGDAFVWSGSSPTPFSGSLALQSSLSAGVHQQYFFGASSTLGINTGDDLVAYVYLDPANPPSEIMLQWNDGSWEHRAYWGANVIPWGTNATASRLFMGALPPTGQWVRLTVPANLVNLEGSTLNGMAFTLNNGRVIWDHAGKASAASGPTPTSTPTATRTPTAGGPSSPPPPGPDNVWIEDSLPAGAAMGGDPLTWMGSNPTPFSGALALQSQLSATTHQQYFFGATDTLPVGVGDTLVAYVYLDPANPPSEIMLQWNDGSWEHRAYWGVNVIPWGVDGTASRRFMGPLPATGQWVRLTMSASQLNLEGSTLNGMAFTLSNGRAYWDHVGTSTSGGAADSTPTQTPTATRTPTTGATTPPPPQAETVWVEDALPAGSSAAGDPLVWSGSNPTPFSGALELQGQLFSDIHQQYFYGATDTLAVNAGDSLMTYVYLDPANPPSEIMLQWLDGSWEHRAYWGVNIIPWGTDGTASRRFIGSLPAVGQWVQLIVPASLVNLEGSTLNGMALTLSNGRAFWDHIGKAGSGAVSSPTPTNPPAAATSTATAVRTSTATSTATPSRTATVAGPTPTSAPAVDSVWVEDGLPLGAAAAGDPFVWPGSNPNAFSGALSLQTLLATDIHQQYFYGATATLRINAGDALLAYIYLDPANPPSEIMLQWFDGAWEHRAYWGTNSIPWGTDGTASRRFAGSLPATGQWARLTVPASLLNLEGSTLSGMAFTLFNGRAFFDRVGKTGVATAGDPTAAPTATSTPTMVPNTPTATWTRTLTATPTSTPTHPIATPTRTSTPTRTPIPTWTRTPTWTPIFTRTPTGTPTETPTRTATPTWTSSRTPTSTPTNSPSPTATATRSLSPTPTATNTPLATGTASATPTATPSPTATPTPDTSAPSIPALTSAAANRCGQIDLSWNGSTDTGGSGLWGYKVYRDGTYVQSVPAPTTSATDTGLASTSSHRYQVSALDNAGNESAASSAMTATTLDCPAVSADLIGFVPDVGSAKDVVMDTRAGLAYVASGEFGLSVVDVSVPGQPQVLGASLPPFYGERVAVSGSLAVVTSNSNGMNVVDVSNPYAPVTVGAMSGIFRGAAMSGNLAYLMQTVPGNPATVDLVVVDLSTPGKPVTVGRTTIGFEANDIEIVGSLAYIAAGSNGLKIADLTSPTSPKIVGGVDTPGTANRVSVGGGYAFVADTTSLVFIDVSGSQPSIVTSLPISASAVAGEGGQIYALVGIQLEVINVGLPVAAPSVVGITASFSAQGIAHDGNVVLLASPQTDPSKGTGGLYLVDASIPSAPNVLTNVYDGFDNWSVAAAGSLAVVTANSFGMRVVDVTDPKGPNSVASLTGVMQAVSMNAQYACELEVVPGNPATIDLVVIDLRSPTQPSRAGRVNISTTASDVKVIGSLAYVAAGGSGFKIVDFSSPSSPRIVGSLSLSSAATKVAVANGYAYVGMGTSVAVVDVNTPSLPRLKTTLSIPVTSLAVAGTNLFVLSGSQLAVVNVSNPLSPAIAGTGPSYNAQQVAAVGNVAVLAKSALNHFDGSGGLYVIDASVPTQQQLVNHIIVPGNTRTITADGNLVYAGDSSSTVDIVNVAQ